MALISKANSKMVMDFSSFFVGLNWPDVNGEKPVLKCNGKGRCKRRHAGEAAQATARKQIALDVVRHRLRRDDVQDKRTEQENMTLSTSGAD